MMQTLSKALVGTVAAGAMAVGSASPAFARDRDRGIDTGDIIAGAVILGGLAAVLGSSRGDRYDRYDRYDRRYDRRYSRNRGYRQNNGRLAVERCVRAAERYAARYSGGRSDVTNIYDVDRKRDGWKIKGNLVVEDRYRGYRNRDRYGYGYRNSRYRGYDEGRFTCRVRYGRIDDLDIKGIRGL